MTPGMQDYHRLRQWLEQQERRLAEVEAENRELRRQLDELRRGVGVSVVIQGRAIPLAAGPVAQMPHEQATFQHSQPGHPQREPVEQAESAFPEDAWLTGKGPAARPASAPGGLASRIRARTPAPQVTPDWLRDGSADANAQSARTSRQAQSPAPQSQAYSYQTREAPSDPGAPYSTGNGMYRHPVPRREAMRSRDGIPTLAQITGSQPVAGASRRQHRGTNPYEDSFVLD
jgi:hypothetical protein